MVSKRLKFLLSEPLKYGATESGEAFNDYTANIRYIRITDINQDGTLRDDGAQFLSAADAAGYDVTKGDILLARSGATVGKAFRYLKDAPAAFAGYLIRARINENVADGIFVHYFFQSHLYWDYIRSYYSQATIQNVNASLYGNILVPCPNLGQQRGIVDFLNRETAKADALIVKYEKLLELLEDKHVATITQAVTKGLDPTVPMKDSGVEQIGEIPAGWQLNRLRPYVISKTDGPFGSGLKNEHYVNNGTRVIRLQNIGIGEFKDDDSSFVLDSYFESLGGHDAMPGDLLVAGLGDEKNPLGRACLLPGDIDRAMVKADCFRYRLDPKHVTHDYVVHFLNSAVGRFACQTVSRGATRQRMNLSAIADVPFPFPPLNEQIVIAEHLVRQSEALEAQKKHLKDAISFAKERRAALITAAVTGQIDVNTYKSDNAKEVA